MVLNIQKRHEIDVGSSGHYVLVLFVVMKTIVHIQCVFKENLRKIFAGIQGYLRFLFPMAC